METFSEARDFTEHPDYARDRSRVLSGLRLREVDAPIRDIVTALGRLPQCFSLQCCYGHFVWKGQGNAKNLEDLPLEEKGAVRYRIAYLALCIERGERGADLRGRLASLCGIDTAYVQFGSPLWFWQQFPNSYALQVEPDRFAHRDEAVLEHSEALHVQSVRNEFFQGLRKILSEAICL